MNKYVVKDIMGFTLEFEAPNIENLRKKVAKTRGLDGLVLDVYQVTTKTMRYKGLKPMTISSNKKVGTIYMPYLLTIGMYNKPFIWKSAEKGSVERVFEPMTGKLRRV